MSAITAKASRKMKKYAVLTREPRCFLGSFDLSWEQRKFSDITFPAGEKNRDNLPLESYSITNEHGFVPQDEKFENGGTMREADKRMYYIVSPNSFAYNPARINVGSIGYQNIGKNVIVSSLYEVFKTSEDVDDRLLWHWFKSPDFQKLIMQLQEGGVRLYFYYDKLCMGEVSLPSLEEQRKIGKLFDTLDNLITLHQRKCALLFSPFQSFISMMFTTSTFSWEQRKLGELGTITTGNTPSTSIPDYYSDDGIVWVTPTDICENITFESARKLSDLGQQVGRVVPKNTILVTCIASIGKNTMLGNTGSFNQQINGLTPNENKYDPYFLLTESALWSAKMKGSAASGTMQIVNRTEFSELKTWLPSLIEQQAIGAFFKQLDNLITLHQRQPFLHSTPEISLTVQLIHPFYTSSWEQRKAIDIADYSKGNGYSKGDLTDAGTPIILYGRLYTKYQFAISEVDTFAVPRNGAVYSQGNEVIVPASGETAEDIARASAVEKSGVLLGGDLNILRPFDFINPLFLALAISNGEPQKELAKKAQGKSVVHIHNTDIQEVTIAYPSRTEQDRIVSVFRQLDNLITLHQRKGKAAVSGCFLNCSSIEKVRRKAEL